VLDVVPVFPHGATEKVQLFDEANHPFLTSFLGVDSIVVEVLELGPFLGGEAFDEVLPSNGVLLFRGRLNEVVGLFIGRELVSPVVESIEYAVLHVVISMLFIHVVFNLVNVLLPDRVGFSSLALEDVGRVFMFAAAGAFGIILVLPSYQCFSIAKFSRGLFGGPSASWNVQGFHSLFTAFPIDLRGGFLGESMVPDPVAGGNGDLDSCIDIVSAGLDDLIVSIPEGPAFFVDGVVVRYRDTIGAGPGKVGPISFGEGIHFDVEEF